MLKYILFICFYFPTIHSKSNKCKIYEPVCSEDNITYPNKCLALKENKKIKKTGSCQNCNCKSEK